MAAPQAFRTCWKSSSCWGPAAMGFPGVYGQLEHLVALMPALQAKAITGLPA
jgi:hypothetical protein